MKNLFRLLSASVDPLKLAMLSISAWAVLLGSCSQNPVTVTLHALQASGNVSFVCRGNDNTAKGHKLDECPDYENQTRRLIGLVTQTATNEIALVDLLDEQIVDVDRTTPGYSFLHVGARPGAIVSTPGGAASFVGVTGLQKNGIYALPTTCLSEPAADQPARDLTTWSACALSSAPGDITVLVDPPAAGTKIPRASCLAPDLESKPTKQDGRECPADLTAESGPAGRRKLLVSLPEEHKLVLLDAQTLLDQDAGTFPPCAVDHEYPLTADLPAARIPQILPLDLTATGDACQTTTYPQVSGSEPPTPAGFALSGDRLYVGDRTQPVVHVLDVADPCAGKELPPLLPQAYLAPQRVVTTSRLAVSPLTPSFKQFVYAIDETDQPTASVMVFDVSPPSANNPTGSLDRTPLIFPGAPRQPYLPPDRLRFSAPVRDVSFVMRDFPEPNASTGVGQFGLACDPYPDHTDAAQFPGIDYRSNSDFTQGARPVNLRGLFGFMMLTNGQIAVIDVEDFDAACRRPITTNGTDVPDYRGCVNDQPASAESKLPALFQTDTGLPTVTNESSCQVVEAHRPRAQALSISSTTVGLRAPTLRSLPQFSNPDPAAVIAVDKQPRLLAVDFASTNPADPKPIPAQVFVSSQLYAHCPPASDVVQPAPCDGSALELPVDPTVPGAQNSLTLPLVEPRSYAQDESPTLTFEGRVFAERTSGFIDPVTSDRSQLHDPDANFCSVGVEDSSSILDAAAALGIPASKRSAWAAAHADYVQITGDFLPSDNVYWTVGAGQQCAGLLSSDSSSHDACETEFGNIETPEVLKETRDLSIVNAFSDRLVVTPRHCANADDCARKLAQLSCCFPAGTAYTVRASQQWLLGAAAGLHDIATGADGRCVHTASCDPRKKYFGSRAFEVCDPSKDKDPNHLCTQNDPNVGCVGGTTAGKVDFPVEPGGAASQCIFENLTARFVVYRGSLPSTRGMQFSWQTTGGFAPLSMSLTTQLTTVNPQSLGYLPELGYLAVIDGSTLGLSLFDLNSLGVVSPSPYF